MDCLTSILLFFDASILSKSYRVGKWEWSKMGLKNVHKNLILEQIIALLYKK